MATLPSNRQIQISQIPGAPAWVAGLIQCLNPLLGAYYDALNAGITIPANLPWLIKTIPAGVNQSLSAAWPYSRKPAGALLVGVQVTAGNHQDAKLTLADGSALSTPVPIILNQWSYVAGKIQLDQVSGLQPNVQYTLTILAF